MRVIQIPMLADNYAYFVVCEQTGAVALVDTPDGPTILQNLDRHELKPTAILNTHHHWDHAGGNADILAQHKIPVYASRFDAKNKRIFGVTHAVMEGARVSVGALEFAVIDVPGHTLGHIAYYGHGALFCGDTLFVGGCGRLFEGTPAQMFASLAKLKQLPDNTRVYCAHEYTQKNLEFALTVEPHNRAVKNKLAVVRKLRAQNLPTVSSTLGEEKTYNPFLRCGSVQNFAAIRRLKDEF